MISFPILCLSADGQKKVIQRIAICRFEITKLGVNHLDDNLDDCLAVVINSMAWDGAWA